MSILTNPNALFVFLCKNGHLSEAQELVLAQPNKIDLSGPDHSHAVLLTACLHGHLNVAQWLHAAICHTISASALEIILASSIMVKQSEVAKWMITEVMGNKQNKVFLRACRTGSLEIAQWVQTHFANVHLNLNLGFIHAVKSKHRHIAEWLAQLNPSKYGRLMTVSSNDVSVQTLLSHALMYVPMLDICKNCNYCAIQAQTNCGHCFCYDCLETFCEEFDIVCPCCKSKISHLCKIV